MSGVVEIGLRYEGKPFGDDVLEQIVRLVLLGRTVTVAFESAEEAQRLGLALAPTERWILSTIEGRKLVLRRKAP